MHLVELNPSINNLRRGSSLDYPDRLLQTTSDPAVPATSRDTQPPALAMLSPVAVSLAIAFTVLMAFALAITCMLYCRASNRRRALDSNDLGFTPLTTIHEESDEEGDTVEMQERSATRTTI